MNTIKILLPPQEQGIEMFEMAQKSMLLPEQVADLTARIKELYDFVDLASERETSKTINVLSIVGALFLPLSLLTGIWSINLFSVKNSVTAGTQQISSDFIYGIVSIAFICSLVFVVNFTKKIINNTRNFHPTVNSFWPLILRSFFAGPVILFFIPVIWSSWLLKNIDKGMLNFFQSNFAVGVSAVWTGAHLLQWIVSRKKQQWSIWDTISLIASTIMLAACILLKLI